MEVVQGCVMLQICLLDGIILSLPCLANRISLGSHFYCTSRRSCGMFVVSVRSMCVCVCQLASKVKGISTFMSTSDLVVKAACSSCKGHGCAVQWYLVIQISALAVIRGQLLLIAIYKGNLWCCLLKPVSIRLWSLYFSSLKSKVALFSLTPPFPPLILSFHHSTHLCLLLFPQERFSVRKKEKQKQKKHRLSVIAASHPLLFSLPISSSGFDVQCLLSVKQRCCAAEEALHLLLYFSLSSELQVKRRLVELGIVLCCAVFL